MAELKDHPNQDQESRRTSFDTSDDLLPIRLIGDLIQELSSIFENWTLYCRFITVKYLQEPKHKQNGKEAVTGKSPTEDKDALLLPDLIANPLLQEKLMKSFCLHLKHCTSFTVVP